MLKIDTGLDGNMCSVEMKGTMIDITAELAGVVQSIYESFSKENHMAGLIFLKDFMCCMEHIAETVAKEVKEVKEKSKESPDPMRLLALMSLLNAIQADKRHEKKDIRSADFDSDEEFKKWFRGGDEE